MLWIWILDTHSCHSHSCHSSLTSSAPLSSHQPLGLKPRELHTTLIVWPATLARWKCLHTSSQSTRAHQENHAPVRAQKRVVCFVCFVCWAAEQTIKSLTCLPKWPASQQVVEHLGLSQWNPSSYTEPGSAGFRWLSVLRHMTMTLIICTKFYQDWLFGIEQAVLPGGVEWSATH